MKSIQKAVPQASRHGSGRKFRMQGPATSDEDASRLDKALEMVTAISYGDSA